MIPLDYKSCSEGFPSDEFLYYLPNLYRKRGIIQNDSPNDISRNLDEKYVELSVLDDFIEWTSVITFRLLSGVIKSAEGRLWQSLCQFV